MQTTLKIVCTVVVPLCLLAGCDAVHRVRGSGGSEKVIEAAVFEGGYGIGWHQKIEVKYSQMHAADGIRVSLWGDPRVVEKVKLRLLRGGPPDVLDMYGLPIWLLIGAGGEIVGQYGKSKDHRAGA